MVPTTLESVYAFVRWRPSISSPDTARGSWASGIADDRFREGGREAFSTNLCLWEVRFSGIRNCDALCGFENIFCILAVASVGFENAADFVAAVVQKPHLQMPAPISAQMTATPTTSMPIRCAGLSMDESILQKGVLAKPGGAQRARDWDIRGL